MYTNDSSRSTTMSTTSPATTLVAAPELGRPVTRHSPHKRSGARGRFRLVAVLCTIALVTLLASFQSNIYARTAVSVTGSASQSHGASAPHTLATATPSATTTIAPAPSALTDAYATTSLSPILPLADLSPDLARYVDSQAGTMGVAIYDVTRGRAYGEDDDSAFTLASSAKVYILCGYLDMLERRGRPATGIERSKMTRMIEYSDNNAAQWLFNRLGGATGQQAYLARIDIDDYAPHGGSWGWARLSPDDMAHILALLRAGAILTPADTSYALGLMGHIEVGTWGVGDTAPKGARVYMKDGWVTGPDGKWAQNSSGIVVDGDETYIISVYTVHNPRYDWSKVQHVCATAAGLLVDN